MQQRRGFIPIKLLVVVAVVGLPAAVLGRDGARVTGPCTGGMDDPKFSAADL